MNSLDAIVISGFENSSYAKTSDMRLKINGEIATIQMIRQYCTDEKPEDDDTILNWHHSPKLNGIAIAGYLQSKGLACAIVDNFAIERETFKALLASNPKIIVVSTTFITDKHALRDLVDRIRQNAGDTPIVVGGPFVLASYMLYLRKNDPDYDTDSARESYLFLEHAGANEPDIDYYIVSSQGLQTLFDLVTRVISGHTADGLPNMGLRTQEGFQFSKITTESEYEPFSIDWRMLPGKYLARKVMNLQASNGCPYNCKFCNFVKNKKATFARPVDEIIQDLLQLQSLGIKYVRFVDDNFRLGKPDLDLVCRRMIDAGVRLKWASFMRLNNLRGVDLELLRESGFIEAQFGLESANPIILQEMNKNIDPELYYGIINDLLMAGINVTACFIIGFPGETRESAQDTIDFIKSLNRTDYKGTFSWALFPFQVIPLSRIYEKSEKEKYGLDGYFGQWRHHTMDSKTAVQIVKSAYFDITSSSPTYAGDNLDVIYRLPSDKRRQFIAIRHQLSKQYQNITGEEIKAAFSSIFRLENGQVA